MSFSTALAKRRLHSTISSPVTLVTRLFFMSCSDVDARGMIRSVEPPLLPWHGNSRVERKETLAKLWRKLICQVLGMQGCLYTTPGTSLEWNPACHGTGRKLCRSDTDDPIHDFVYHAGKHSLLSWSSCAALNGIKDPHGGRQVMNTKVPSGRS